MTIEDQITRAADPWWNAEDFEKRYGIRLWDESSPLLAQFRIWGEGYKSRSEFYRDNAVHRFVFETFLQNRDLVPIRFASVQLGMRVSSFQKMLDLMAGESNGLISPIEKQGVYPGVYTRQFIRDLPKRFPAFRRMTFSSNTAYVRLLHETISKVLGFEPDVENCSTSVTIGEAEPESATDYDILTNEPIGLQFQIWLDFKKPIHLRPDACSALTYVRNEAKLTPYLLGSRGDDVLQPVRLWLAANENT